MDKQEVKNFLTAQVKRRMELLGLHPGSPGNDTDLVKEGIFDSLSYVDLIADCENRFGIIIDLEKYQPGEFTKFGKLVEMILEAPKS
jgi:acyl carrier protein